MYFHAVQVQRDLLPAACIDNAPSHLHEFTMATIRECLTQL